MKLSPENIEILNNKAQCYYFLNEYAKCIGLCQKVIRLNPKDATALETWNNAYMIANSQSLPKPPFSIKRVMDTVLFLVTIISIIVILCLVINYVLIYFL